MCRSNLSTLATLVGALVFLNLQSVFAHVYIKTWKSTTENNFQLAQKQPASKTAYRDASGNIGWIGSNFLSGDRAIVCGASQTPYASVASPSGRYFSDASEAVGKITLVAAGDAGKGFPHPKGHIQAYLGYCGASRTACQKFDAASAYYFKIQEVKNGVQDKLRPAMNYDLDGNLWEVPIPSDVPQGSYIFRFEIIAFDQSNESEGHQDQYYPSCGQIYVTSNVQTKTLKSFSNSEQASAPGPEVIQRGSTYAAAGISSDSVSKAKSVVIKSANATETSATLTSQDTENTGNSSNSTLNSNDDVDQTTSSNSSTQGSTGICLSQLIPSCAKMCLAKKHEEISSLAAGCSATDGKCLCSKQSFVQAYENCVRDHCAAGAELTSALSAFTSQCKTLTKQDSSSYTSTTRTRRHRRHHPYPSGPSVNPHRR
ncbi:glycosyl hydrolase family 61-domain-containing protein [Melampsora americana]|nr:glycosyl hydrolase family 61-domain-containing protein [Melampsora americana]